jgi:Fe-S cluster biogenesis protein NfuA
MSGERIEALLGEIRASADPATLGRVEELVEQLVDLYGTGLARIVGLLRDANALDDGLRRGMADDPLVSALLTLHGLHPDDVAARIEQALDRVRPYLESHAGGVALLGVDEQRVAHVRMEGSCDGCASSAATVRELVERAIQEAAPEVTHVAVEAAGSPAEPHLVQLRRAP